MLKHRRFERRPHFPTDRSDSSSLQLSSLPYAMSENNLHEVETQGGGTIQPSKLKLQNELKLHFHNRHMSNPAHYQSCDAAKPTVVLKAKAASRLMFNRQESLSRNEGEILSQRHTAMSKARSPSSLTCNNIQEKIEDIMKSFNQDRQNCMCST